LVRLAEHEEEVSCVFCEIITGKASAEIVLDDDVALAFLDKKPLFVGHVLVVPRAHVVTLPEVPEAEIGLFFQRVRKISAAVPRALGAQGTFVAMNNIVSQSVPHLHVHVVPRTKGDGLRGFFWPRTSYSSAEALKDTAEKIRRALTS
jgi:histidine triad (HIT) family protein